MKVSTIVKGAALIVFSAALTICLKGTLITSGAPDMARVDDPPAAERRVYVFLKMEMVNDIIDVLEEQEEMDEVHGFFYGYVRNCVTSPEWEALHGKQQPEITEGIVRAIIASSREHKVPVTLAFALAQCESVFNPGAYNRNGMVRVSGRKLVESRDIGLFQCNNITFVYGGRVRSERELYVIETNADQAMWYMRANYDENALGGKSWLKAIVAYNSGSARESKVLRRGTITVGHLKTVMELEGDIRMKFCEAFGRAL